MPATYAEITAVLLLEEFDAADKWVVMWQFGLLGDFETALARAIATADESNLLLLTSSYPMQVEGFRRWSRGDLGKRLRAAGLNI